MLLTVNVITLVIVFGQGVCILPWSYTFNLLGLCVKDLTTEDIESYSLMLLLLFIMIKYSNCLEKKKKRTWGRKQRQNIRSRKPWVCVCFTETQSIASRRCNQTATYCQSSWESEGVLATPRINYPWFFG